LQLIALHGEEADRHLLRCLFSFVEVGSADSKGSLQIQLLQQECATLVSKHRVASNLCYAFEQTIHLQKVKMTQRPAKIYSMLLNATKFLAQSAKSAQQLLSSLGRLLRCSPAQEVVFGLALLHSTNSDIKSQSLGFLKQKFPEFVRLFTEAGLKIFCCSQFSVCLG
jgi:CCR4-NOT transcription complex subunit 1